MRSPWTVFSPTPGTLSRIRSLSRCVESGWRPFVSHHWR